MLDPWSAGGVTEAESDSIVLVKIKEGAHHLDLRAAHPMDPPSVIQARALEKLTVQGWLGNHKRVSFFILWFS